MSRIVATCSACRPDVRRPPHGRCTVRSESARIRAVSPRMRITHTASDAAFHRIGAFRQVRSIDDAVEREIRSVSTLQERVPPSLSRARTCRTVEKTRSSQAIVSGRPRCTSCGRIVSRRRTHATGVTPRVESPRTQHARTLDRCESRRAGPRTRSSGTGGRAPTR